MHEHGGPEVLRYEDVPDPQPGRARPRPRARVRAQPPRPLDAHRACPARSVTFRTSSATTSRARSRPCARPSRADRRRPARDALARHLVRALPACACPARTAPAGATASSAYQFRGGYAELVRCPPPNVIPLPDAHLLRGGGRLSPRLPHRLAHARHAGPGLRVGEDVLVWAAGSGVGMAAIQVGQAARRARHRHRGQRGEARAGARAGRGRRDRPSRARRGGGGEALTARKGRGRGGRARRRRPPGSGRSCPSPTAGGS